MGLGSIEKNLKNLPPVLRPQRLSSRVTLTCLPSRQRRGRGAKTPYQIVTKFCTEVIHAKFDDHRFGVWGTLGVKFHHFPLNFIELRCYAVVLETPSALP